VANRPIKDAEDKLIACARAEFLEKGYEAASLRTIAATAGVSTYPIYLRFKDKAGLFTAVVRPAAAKFVGTYESEMECFNRLCPDLPYDEMTQYMLRRIYTLVDVIYEDYDTFCLLAANTESGEYESFIHQLVEIQGRQALRYYEAIRDKAAPYEQIPSELLHLTYTTQFSGMFEVVRHRMNKERALEYFAKLQVFFFAGYKALLGLNS
jgi:AcrR family transcriptional regulator